ncbi:MAG: transketolase [Desulfobacterota bacterium]|nr:transketolase [Thermodesulfobacteriota bacterium]
MLRKRFEAEKLDPATVQRLSELARLARGDILKMTTLAGSGHPGGSMSSIDLYLVLYTNARIDPKHPEDPERDRFVISHGHTSPGVYAALGRTGFFPIETAIVHFRRAGSPFEGHVEKGIPGLDWNTGNLGQGLSAGCGFALAAKVLKKDFHVFVAMGCGEQQKGQISEARRFAIKYGLHNLTVLIDYNQRQISGVTGEIMPQNIAKNFESDGWRVIEIDGHQFQEIYQACREATLFHHPTAILAHTVMGKGVSFMEGKEEFHGRALTLEEYRRAIQELGLEDDLDRYRDLRQRGGLLYEGRRYPKTVIPLNEGRPRDYGKDQRLDNRTAFGNALLDLGRANLRPDGSLPIVVFDCDLASSTKTNLFGKQFPDHFFQSGIQEHHTATLSGAISTTGLLSFFADFGVFGIDETYNQHRLNDLNETNLKLICTHNGLDVGEDGKTHQCIDYIGVMRNLFGFKIIVPADPNQTDRVIRYVARAEGNFLVAMGRSPAPIILTEDGHPYFATPYEFRYGKADLIRDGKDAAILTAGSMVHRALEAWARLKAEGIEVQILNLSCMSDLDLEAILRAAQTGRVITYEDHHVQTGLGSLIANVLAEQRRSVRFRKLGISRYGASGKPEDLYRMQGLDVDSLVRAVMEEIERKD